MAGGFDVPADWKILVKDEDEVAKLVQVLNSTSRPEEKWGYAFGVRAHRPHGSYHEAYAVVWRKDRVELGNGVVGGVWDAEEAFRNDPYLVSFKRNNFDFTMMLVHTRWSNDADGTRANEVAMVAEQIVWLQGFLSERDYIVMGDFNYSATAKAMQDMATTAELVRVDPNDKSTFKSNFSAYASPYDHIFLTEGVMNEYIAHSAQVLDTTKLLYGANSIANMKLSNKELSDHLPVFAVFKTSGADDD